jgi:UDP-galactopyranose mutase
LPYRSLRFEHVNLEREWHQPVAVVNYPQEQPYTRLTEYKHLTGQKHPRTSLTYEYPTDDGDPTIRFQGPRISSCSSNMNSSPNCSRR